MGVIKFILGRPKPSSRGMLPRVPLQGYVVDDEVDRGLEFIGQCVS
jgi:hypothetical protein